MNTAYTRFNLRFLLIAMAFFVLSAVSCATAETDSENSLSACQLPSFISGADFLVFKSKTEPLGFDAHHVQGIVVTEDHFIFTSVDKPSFAAWVFKLSRADLALVDSRNVADMMDFHPGGLDFDGRFLWIPVAVYSPDSHANMVIADPETLRFKTVFEVHDHIGAAARIPGFIVGGNWSCEQFYFWDKDGILIDKRESPTGVGYQDCKGEYGCLMCTGGGYLDWIDPAEWKLVKRFVLGESDLGSPLSREGGALLGESVFFLPDDGAEGRIYEYGFAAAGEGDNSGE